MKSQILILFIYPCRPSKCRRKNIQEELPNSEDIFGDLLKQQENSRHEMFTHMSDSKVKQSINEKFRRISLKQEELLYQSDSNILEVQVHEKLITLLVDDSGSVRLCILIWDVQNNKLKILQNVATSLSLKLFVCKYSLLKFHFYFKLIFYHH